MNYLWRQLKKRDWDTFLSNQVLQNEQNSSGKKIDNVNTSGKTCANIVTPLDA